MSELRFEAVTVKYGALTAVDQVSLRIGAGEIVALVGESGSGKSTLARAAVGLAPITAGRVTMNGQPVAGRQSRGALGLQMVFQDPYSSLDPTMTVSRIVAEGLQDIRGKKDTQAEVTRLLELVRLDPVLARHRPAQLSGGQRQRVALARALATRPKVLIADEITSALDVSVQGAVLNLIRSLVDELGLSLLFISHNLAVVRQVCDKVAVMYLGQVVEFGQVDELTTHPEHPYTRVLLDSSPRFGVPLIEPDEDARLAAARDVEPPDPHHPPTGCYFHPRCPVGPLINEGREICMTAQPTSDGRRNLAMCHFAEMVEPTNSAANEGITQ